MRPELVVSVDVGTTKTAVLVGELMEAGGLKIIGASSISSSGMRKGAVVNIEEASASLRLAVEKAGKMAGVVVEGVCTGISGMQVRSFNSRGVKSIPQDQKEITASDVDAVTDSAGSVVLPSDMEILHRIPLDFMVDRQRGIRDPIGMSASRLGVEVHMVAAEAPHLDNFMKIFEKNGLDVMEIVFQPLAAAEALLSPEDKESGALVIDLGGGITDFALYHGGCVRASGVIPAGGENITKDLAIGLRVPENVAERIKLENGLALASMAGEDEMIVVPGEQGNAGKEIRRSIVAAIIEPRCEEIFSMIKEAVSTDPHCSALGGGVVLTGGGCRISGMKSVAEQVFGMPARRGVPCGMEGLSEMVGDESWSAAAGLLHHEAGRLLREEEERGSRGRFGWMLGNIRKIASLF